MSNQERIKFQGMIPKGKRRLIEIEWRKGKDPTLQTWNDVVDFCAEAGLEKLAAMNGSEAGKYAAYVYGLKRQKEADEALKKAEWEVQGYQPRKFSDAEIRPFRMVEDG